MWLTQKSDSNDSPPRGWFARTFVEPIERFILALKRFVIVTLLVAGSLIVGFVLLGLLLPRPPASSSLVSPPITSGSPPITSSSDKKFVPPTPKKPAESAAERAYEEKHNVEIVHKKDGTTYTRKKPAK